MSEDDVEERLIAVLGQLGNLSAVVKFDLGGESWLIDARQAKASLSRGDGEADCTICTTAENLLKLLDGRLDPMLAYSLGKLKVRGSMGVAIKLVAAIG